MAIEHLQNQLNYKSYSYLFSILKESYLYLMTRMINSNRMIFVLEISFQNMSCISIFTNLMVHLFKSLSHSILTAFDVIDFTQKGVFGCIINSIYSLFVSDLHYTQLTVDLRCISMKKIFSNLFLCVLSYPSSFSFVKTFRSHFQRTFRFLQSF